MNLGQYIYNFRDKYRVSASSLAAQCGLKSGAGIKGAENGASPHGVTLIGLSKGLGVPVGKLMDMPPGAAMNTKKIFDNKDRWPDRWKAPTQVVVATKAATSSRETKVDELLLDCLCDMSHDQKCDLLGDLLRPSK